MLTDAQVRKIKPLEKKTKYSDEKGYMHDLTKIQLAHRVSNAISQTYNNAQHLVEHRIKMMQDWSDVIDSLRNKISY
ncbi:hypothetical protein P255_02520 [Acinetobacter brisouii CIP 110357]|uniref:Tyr recombinase domain-containing protein n=1 Tax=Acinetobacter brisouii CIP 110357 TaxID=1341683 RepID=V2UKN3_9GAMM|nr:hypothetical protein F954_02037 [Acinetobacter brisouii ANC 4119]ESK50537.1 hypothetical protein P255_02520 [Acinetobacter brisouii CIP 110357]